MKEKSIFGYEEILLDIPRQTTIRAVTETDLFYLNREAFERLIKDEDILHALKSKIIPMDVEKIAKNILTIKSLTKFKVRIHYDLKFIE